MNPKHVHTPGSAGAQRKRCPVCQQAVYSRAGIHPQCAMKQSEPPRPKREVAVPVAVVIPEIETPEVAPTLVS